MNIQKIVVRTGYFVATILVLWLSIRAYIYGGAPAPLGTYPWQASISSDYKPWKGHFCGGVIVGDVWVLTAAHCVYDYEGRPGLLTITVGLVDLFRAPKNNKYSVANILPHPNSGANWSKSSDLSLLKLSRPISSGSAKVIPVIADNTNAATYIDEFSVAGWGRTSERRGSRVSVLQYITGVKLVDETTCATKYPAYRVGMICANKKGANQGFCSGDSGGAMVDVNDFGSEKLVGLVSGPSDCSLNEQIGIYTDVAHYADWIARCMGDVTEQECLKP